MNQEPNSNLSRLTMPANEYLSQGFRAFNWTTVILYGVGAGLLMPISLVQSNVLAVIAGVVPVTVGLLLARSAKGFYGLYGFMTGLIGAITSTTLLAVLIFLTGNAELVAQLSPESVTPMSTWLTASGFISFSLIAFCTFGTITTGRMEERNREARSQNAARGGNLERPSAIREVSDIRGLLLPQLGGFVNTLFKKKGYALRDYKFTDKDRYVDLWYDYQDAVWQVRCVVAEKVSSGVVESLLQEMKRAGIPKGIVVTSTEFASSATKGAKDKPVVLIDGDTLFEISR
ncbi:MAG: restriction endonuclease [Chloroflexi bacterium]|jgi:hypothetical protein|nr:MAG: restriction endonuclease [Chloroflexota bacterium]